MLKYNYAYAAMFILQNLVLKYGFFGFNIPVYFHRRRCCAFVFTTIAAKTKKIALSLKKDTFCKPSKRDMQEAFVIHVQNPEDVLVTISRKQEKCF
ncbi:hypothetical protein Avbf_17598 [Armadillidium vulgare]|nr:hypothetical protein Avbf_17598 [Armadillidium vulgare]